MKKALLLLALLCALGAVIAFTVRRAGGVGAPFPAARAAELAPADTIAFLQVPDIARTLTRWKSSELAALVGDPELQTLFWQRRIEERVQAWMERSYLGPFLWSARAQLRDVDVDGFFLAVTDAAKRTSPSMVGGFSYRGKKADLENFVRAQKEKLFTAWAGAKSELSTHDGIEIESISHTPPPAAPNPASTPASGLWASFGTLAAPIPQPEFHAVHLAFRDNWLFVATDRALLADTLDRYVRKPGAAKSLAEDTVFAECHEHATPDADLVAWANWEPLGKEFAAGALTAFASAEPRAPRALHYSAKFDGAQMRDRLYYSFAQPPRAPDPRRPPLALPGSNAAFRAVIDFDRWRGRAKALHAAFWRAAQFDAIEAKAASAALAVDDLWTAFGPVVTIASCQSGPRPDYSLAFQVRDAEKAQKFFELAQAHGFFKEVVPVENEPPSVLKRWYAGGEQTALPPMSLTKTHLLVGFSNSVLQQAVAAASTGAAGPEPSASKSAPGTVALFAFDMAKLLATFKGWLQPNLDWRFGIGGTSIHIPIAPLGKHLGPTAATARVVEHGWLIEGAGPAGFLGACQFVEWLEGLPF